MLNGLLALLGVAWYNRTHRVALLKLNKSISSGNERMP